MRNSPEVGAVREEIAREKSGQIQSYSDMGGAGVGVHNIFDTRSRGGTRTNRS